MQTVCPLVNESQVGTRLNEAIEHNRRSEFALLLSLMSVDARDMAQFQWDRELDSASRLRKQFELSPEQPLCVDLSQQSSVVDHSGTYREAGSVAFRLQQALRPEALVIRGRESIAMAEVLANCDTVTQLRQRNQAYLPSIDTPLLVEQLTNQRNLARLTA